MSVFYFFRCLCCGAAINGSNIVLQHKDLGVLLGCWGLHFGLRTFIDARVEIDMEMYNEQFFNDSMKKMVDWQAKAYEPVRKMGESAAEAYEKCVRLGYASMGDMVDFYVEQAHMMATTTDVRAYFENQQTAMSQLNNTVSSRAAEFVDLASDIQHEAKEAMSSAIKQAGKSAPKAEAKTTKKTA